jgi:hypothetical protein
VLIVAVAVFGYLGWRLLRNARPAARQYAEDYRVATEQRRTAVEWEQDAASLERAGDWRGALRCRYRGLIARLGTAGVVDEIPGRTAGEYRRDVGSARPTAAAPFAQATDLFERAWYGGARTDRDDAERFRALASNVLVEANR